MPSQGKRRKKPKTLGYVGRGQPYLWYREPRGSRAGAWIIRHLDRQVGTGCGAGEDQGALAALEEYRASLHRPITEKNLPAHRVHIADVVSRYLTAREGAVARPRELGQRMTAILEWWGERTLADIDSVTCSAYVADRVGTPWRTHSRKTKRPARGAGRPPKKRVVSEAAARRELEDLRAAVNLAIADGITREIVRVVLPPKAPERDRWLTKPEAARLILAAWRKREVQKGVVTDRRCAQHLARFILVALRTGTRAGAVCKASFLPEVGLPWMELKVEDGRRVAIFHRRALGTVERGNKRYPTVRMPDSLVPHLWRWHHKLGQRYVVEWRGHAAASTQKAFANLVHELGLKDVVRHTLRHTAATWGMQAGVPVWELSGYLGMSVEVLERRYGHHSPDHMEGAREALGGRSGRKRKAA